MTKLIITTVPMFLVIFACALAMLIAETAGNYQVFFAVYAFAWLTVYDWYRANK